MQPVIYPDGYVKEALLSALSLYMESFSLCLAGGMNLDSRLSPYTERYIVRPIRTRRPYPSNVHEVLREYTKLVSDHLDEVHTMKA
jgi:hypothetical protein